jgi:hypothetical protein
VYNHVAAFSASSVASVPGTCEIERINPVRIDVNLPHVLEEILGKETLLAASLPFTEQHRRRIGYRWTSIGAAQLLHWYLPLIFRSVLQIIVLVVFIIL